MPAEELDIDLAPFRTLAGAAIGMTGHVRYTAWDAENPATQSPFMIGEVIRKRIGFDGLLMTDDLDMEALAGSVPERAARAIAAGCDLVLNCWAKMDDMVGIASATPTISAARGTAGARAAGHDRFRFPAPMERQAALVARRDAARAGGGARLMEQAPPRLPRCSMAMRCGTAWPRRRPRTLRSIWSWTAGKGRSTCCSIWRGGRRWISGGFRSSNWWTSTSAISSGPRR
jgi:hypothetical protein